MDKEKDINNTIHNDIHDNAGPIFCGVVYQPTFVQPGANLTQNIVNKNDAKDVAEEVDLSDKPESIEEQKEELTDEKKKNIINTITSLFNFDDKDFCKDNNGKRITNERLAILFRLCFGCGAHPSKELLSVIKTLWGLLIYKRNQCFKKPDEDYFRQTVLNILGYYKESGIICGNKLELARSVFEDADESLAKNIERGITSPVFPSKTRELLDLYIDKLKKGDY